MNILLLETHNAVPSIYHFLLMFIFSSRSFYLPTCTPVATYLLRPQPPKELLQTVSYIVIITAIYW